MTAIENLLKKRLEIKKKKPHFTRTDSSILKRIPDKWRRPRGRDNKVRRRIRGSLASPSYSSPKKVRGMHPRGLFEVLVSTPGDLDELDAKKHIIRIRGTVGNRKKRDIIKKAKQLKLYILNPKIKLKTKTPEKKKKEEPKKEAEKKEAEKKESAPEKEEKKVTPHPAEKKKAQKKAKKKPEEKKAHKTAKKKKTVKKPKK